MQSIKDIQKLTRIFIGSLESDMPLLQDYRGTHFSAIISFLLAWHSHCQRVSGVIFIRGWLLSRGTAHCLSVYILYCTWQESRREHVQCRSIPDYLARALWVVVAVSRMHIRLSTFSFPKRSKDLFRYSDCATFALLFRCIYRSFVGAAFDVLEDFWPSDVIFEFVRDADDENLTPISSLYIERSTPSGNPSYHNILVIGSKRSQTSSVPQLCIA